MRQQIRHKSDRGFTLVELAIVFVIIGILAAVSAPNLLGLLNRYRVKQATHVLVGAIKEAQGQAMRQGKICRIEIDTSSNTLTGQPTNCLLSERRINDRLTLRTNIPGTIPNIAFSYRGSTTKMGTIVVSAKNVEMQQCFVISLGTGIARTGIYTGAKTGSVSAANCQKI